MRSEPSLSLGRSASKGSTAGRVPRRGIKDAPESTRRPQLRRAGEAPASAEKEPLPLPELLPPPGLGRTCLSAAAPAADASGTEGGLVDSSNQRAAPLDVPAGRPPSHVLSTFRLALVPLPALALRNHPARPTHSLAFALPTSDFCALIRHLWFVAAAVVPDHRLPAPNVDDHELHERLGRRRLETHART